MEIYRDHDRLYLHEDRKHAPKEAFKFIHGHASPFLSKLAKPKILDIGCATGDFLYYMSTLYPQADLTGLDIMPELVERARKEVPTARVLLGNVMERATLPPEKYDAIFLNGVHSIFDDYKPWIDNILNALAPGGRAFIFGLFNRDDFDVLLKVRPSGETGDSWQSGWNMISKKSVSLYLDQKSIKHRFEDWTLELDIPKNPTDHLRSWTFPLKDGTRGIVNGTCLLHTFSYLEMIPGR